jgi:hypothetical protein
MNNFRKKEEEQQDGQEETFPVEITTSTYYT